MALNTESKLYNIEWFANSVLKQNEIHIVTENKFYLDYIPDSRQGISMSNSNGQMVEVKYNGLVQSIDQFKVDYNNNKIEVFHTLNGTYVTVNQYYARGLIKINAERVELQDKNNLYKASNVEDFATEIAHNVSDLYIEVNDRVNNLIINTPQPSEVVDARYDSINNIIYPLLKDRLDTDKSEFNDYKNEFDSHMNEYAKIRVSDYNIPKTLRLLYEGYPISIVFVGDSIGGGAGASSTYTTWTGLVQAKLQELYPTVVFTFHNSSMGGTGTTWLRDNWDTLVPPYNPDLILMYHGTNDTATTDDVVKSNYAFFKEQIQALGAEIIISTTSTNAFSPSPYGNTASQSSYEALEHEAQLVRDIANKYKWGYVDCNLIRHKFLTSIGANYESTLTHFDHIHPNDVGHRLIAYGFIMPFLGGIDSTTLDDRYAGKNMSICDSYKTLYDLNKLYGKLNEWERYGLYHQQVTSGGMWTQNETTGTFKTAKLWATDVITGSETYTPENPFRHIVALQPDFIKFEVEDVKRVWTQLTGSSATATSFAVLVDGVITMALSISSTSAAPIEIQCASGVLDFPKGKHTIEIRRQGNIPAVNYVEWYGFLVRHYDFNKSEKNPNILRIPKQINSKDILTTTRQIAKDNGVVMPFGYGSADVGFIFPSYGVNVLAWKFWGTDIKLKLGSITGSQNKVMVYIDGVYSTTLDLQSDPTTQNVYTLATGLSTNTEHEVILLGLKSQINLFEIISTGTDLNTFGVCGSSIPVIGFDTKTLPNVLITPYYAETGKIPITNATTRAYIYTFGLGDWVQGTAGYGGLDYMQCTTLNSQVKIKFHGTAILLRHSAFGSGGIFNVTIDGVDKGSVNTNGAGVVASATYSGLADGYHEMVITKTSSSATVVQLIDIEQTGITIPTFQYVSELKPTSFKVIGTGEFIYTVY